MDDYYSYKPLVTLDAPLAVIGFPGCRPLQTVRVATMLTGLKAVLLPHQVAHRVSMQVEGLLLSDRKDELHAAERDLLRRALEGGARPMIALGPTTVEDPELRAWLRERVQFLYLRQTLPEAVTAIAADQAEDGRKHQHLRAWGGFGEAELAPLHALRDALHTRLADFTVDVAGRSPLDVGRALPDALGWAAAS